ncbi:hypothetical protein KKG46_05570 [Patescibacteria group bacterium]|nr:hypothetical protein [Patescibacteria group bacterium]
MNKSVITSLMLLSLVFLAAGCVEVENLDKSQNPPQIDQVSEETYNNATNVNTPDEVASGTEMMATSTEAATTTEVVNEVAEKPSNWVDPNVTPNAKKEYCSNYGGIYTEVNNLKETWGACYFKDGTMCEILSFMRGECQMGGGCYEECWSIGTSDEGWYESCTKKLIRWDKCSSKVSQ